MKKILFMLCVVLTTLCSCSKEDSENFKENNITYDLFGVWDVSEIPSTCNIPSGELFVFYSNSKDYFTEFRNNNYGFKTGNEIGEIYGGYHSYRINNYELNNNIITFYISYPNDSDGFVYRLSFKIIDYHYHNYMYLECVNREKMEFMKINIGDQIKITYLGYTFEEWWDKK